VNFKSFITKIMHIEGTSKTVTYVLSIVTTNKMRIRKYLRTKYTSR